MKPAKLIILIAVTLAFVSIFYWALFVPKEDISTRIYRTLKEQETRADLGFKKVTFEEVLAGQKFWQLQAETAIVNKDTGLASLQTTKGTFYKNGKASLNFISPAALWDMKKKEIFLDKPLGYDSAYKNIIHTLPRASNVSTFTFPKDKPGYWFQAKNLSWKLADQLITCAGGIVLNKGEVSGRADSLKGDVEFKKVELFGNPRILVTLADKSLITIEARSVEFYSRENQFKLNNNVKITGSTFTAKGDNAVYLIKDESIVIIGNARGTQGDSTLSSKKIKVSIKDQKLELLGKSKVLVNEL
ncbi:MAG: LptA/OstA family protein [bacterium]